MQNWGILACTLGTIHAKQDDFIPSYKPDMADFQKTNSIFKIEGIFLAQGHCVTINWLSLYS